MSRRKVVLLALGRDAADFYLHDLLEPYYRRTGDAGVKDDMDFIRAEIERFWPEDAAAQKEFEGEPLMKQGDT